MPIERIWQNEKMIKQTSVEEFNAMMEVGECQVIDVREFSEFNSERIADAQFMPLSNFERHAAEIDHSKPVYIMCRSGNRAKQAAERLVKKGFTDIYVIEGGMQAWAQAGLPVVEGESKVWALERQVRFVAGLLVLSSVLLAIFVHWYFVGIAGFVGAGLTFAGATDTCGMAMLLARMPWNQKKTVQEQA